MVFAKISKRVAYGLMALAAVMWATSGTFTVLAIDAGAGVMQVTVFTTVITAIILVPLIATFDPKSLRIKAEDFLPFLAFSIITGTFFAIAWYMCVDLTSVATAVILLYAYPSIVTVASVFLLKEGLSPQKALALPLTFVGAVLVAGAQEFEEGFSFNLVGIALGIYAAFGAAVYYIWGKKFLGKYSANTVILYMTVLSIPGLVIIANPFELLKNAISMEGWLYIIALGFFPGTVGFVVSMVALKHIEASKASIVASIEPVAAVIIAVVVLLEAVNGLQIIGVVLVFAGVILLRMAWRKKGVETTLEDVPVILEK
ncbi:MAG: DMT family transporter [Thermoplasmatota archaeon]|nr:DMT family transporter [Candidatus Thermoplasmatota archaeon]